MIDPTESEELTHNSWKLERYDVDRRHLFLLLCIGTFAI